MGSSPTPGTGSRRGFVASCGFLALPRFWLLQYRCSKYATVVSQATRIESETSNGVRFQPGDEEWPLWYVQYREGGRWKMANSRQTSKAKALRFLHLAEERVAQGKVGIEPDRPGTMFDAVADEWLKLHSKVERVSHEDNVGRMKRLREAFGKLQVSEITPGRIDLFKSRMAAEPRRDDKGEPITDPETREEVRRWAPATVNRTLALLRKVLNDSVRWGHLQHAPKVRLLKVPEQPFLFLRREQASEFLALAAEKTPNDAPLYQAAIYTGARMGGALRPALVGRRL